AIAHHSPSLGLAVSKDRAVAVSYLPNTPITGKSYTTSVDATGRLRHHWSPSASYKARHRDDVLVVHG
ncbi:hypothetical protein, partial [Micromonospora globbae]|uniref:hypothetical protein n=1 Tax=Micromonospora globbae TaxID=1894969 RepID=UPI001958EABA